VDQAQDAANVEKPILLTFWLLPTQAPKPSHNVFTSKLSIATHKGKFPPCLPAGPRDGIKTYKQSKLHIGVARCLSLCLCLDGHFGEPRLVEEAGCCSCVRSTKAQS
jgi:hypothetical protein